LNEITKENEKAKFENVQLNLKKKT